MPWERIRQIFAELVERFRKHDGETAEDVDDDDVEELVYGEEWGLVPEDDDVVLAAAFKKPLLKQTKKGAAAACRRIAKRLQGMSEPIAL